MNIDITGYIEFNETNYTFKYKENCLTLIICNQQEDKDITSYAFRKKEKIEWFNGYTSDGFAISFFVNDYSSKWMGTYRCFPKLVFVALKKDIDLSKCKFNSIKFVGGVIDRFYSNAIILESDLTTFINNRELKFKNAEDTAKEEKIIIDNKQAIFQVSVSNMGWSVDGNIHFNNIPSVVRLKFKKKLKYDNFVNSILTFNDLMFFCLNRRKINYENIYLETLNNEDKYINSVKVLIPLSAEDSNFSQKYMLQYNQISGKISKLIKTLNTIKYSTYRIPKDNNEYATISAKNYTSAFSAYQSIYNHVNTKNGIVYDHNDFDDAKKEICDTLFLLSEKYRGKDSKKRKFIKRFLNIVEKSDLKLEDMIMSGIDEFSFVKETINDEKYKNIINDLQNSIFEAVGDRDLITHDDVFAPTDIDAVVYLLIERISYSMILKKIGLSKKNIEKNVRYLSSLGII